MNSLILRKLQLVSLLLNRVEYLEWPKELCLQIPVPLGFDVLAIEPNLFTWCIAP